MPSPPSGEVPEPPAPAIVQAPLTARPGTLKERGRAFLDERRGRAAGRYAIQLMVACREESVEKLLNETGAAGSVWFIPYSHQGKDCFKVFWGFYRSSSEAEAARSALPSAVAGVLPKVPVVSLEKTLR